MRFALRVLAVVTVALALLTVRAIVGGEMALAASTEALVRGDVRAAVVDARLSAQFFVPGAPHVRVAYERLLAIGREAMARKLDADARFAFEAVRTAALSTRWVTVPHGAALDEADRAIAAIDARAPRPPAHADDPPSRFEREVLDLLSKPAPSRIPIHAALAASFVAMVFGAIHALRRADSTGRLPFARARFGLVIAAAGLAVWVAVLALG